MKIGKLHVLDKCRVCGVAVQPLRLRLCNACEDRAIWAKEERKLRDMAAMAPPADGDDDLRRLFDAYTSPHAHTLALILGDVQKDGYPVGYAHWQDFVSDVMQAMEAHDAGAFPDDWWPPEPDEDAS